MVEIFKQPSSKQLPANLFITLFKNLCVDLTQIEPSSPHPSIDRLSVTFAISTADQDGAGASSQHEADEPAAAQQSSFPAAASSSFEYQLPRRRTLTLDKNFGYPRSPDMLRGNGKLVSSEFRFFQNIFLRHTDSEDVAEEDDYSASACAIIQRRNSSRRHSRRKRRPSSPFNPDAGAEVGLRRRSSVFTTSSGE